MPQTARRKHPLTTTAVVILLVILVVAAIMAVVQMQRATKQRATHYQQLMSLTQINQPPIQAPNFTLTTQHGDKLSLSSLRGKEVVLDFMDPECTDICPIVSQELIDANTLLSSRSNEVVFLAVNVNQYHASVSDVEAFSKAHGLAKLPNWYFLTGSTADLQAIWKAYGVSVVPTKTGDVQHSSLMYFIDKQGTEQYLANPDNAKSTIQQWGQGINWVAEKLL